jgi:hypothetical protein
MPAYNPSYSGGRGRRMEVQSQLGKSTRPYLKKFLKAKN